MHAALSPTTSPTAGAFRPHEPGRRRVPRAAAFRTFAALCLLLLTGCANKSLVRFEKIAAAAAKDEYLGAAERIRKDQALYGSQSTLLYHMDLGILYHYAGMWDSSIVHLSKAVQIHDDLFARSVTNEALSVVTNDNLRPYRGRPHEILLLHQFLAFDYLAKGDNDGARVEARQAQIFLDEVKRKAGPKDWRDDGMFRYFSALTYEAGREADDAAIAYYLAVKAYKDGPVPLPGAVARQARTALLAGGRDNDIKELGLSADVAESKLALGGTGSAGDSEGEIVVVGHAGRGPTLDQTVFWGTWVRDGVMVIHYRNPQGEVMTQALPAPGLPAKEIEKAEKGRKTRSGTTFHIKFAMPALKSVSSRTRYFSVTGAGLGAPVRTEALTDLEPLLERSLEEAKTATLTRTVIRVVLRTIASQQTKDALSGGNPLLNLLVNVGTDVLADQLEQADARCWFLLPRSVQVARIPVKPGTHSIEVVARGEGGAALKTRTFENIEVKPGQKKFVFVPSLQ